MKIEFYLLSKPYPFFKIVRDGKSIVISFTKFYLRIEL